MARLAKRDYSDNLQVYRYDPLLWCLKELVFTPGQAEAPSRLSKQYLFSFLDAHLTSASGEERASLDELLYEKFTEYAVLNKMLADFRLHRPKFVWVHPDVLLAPMNRRAPQREGRDNVTIPNVEAHVDPPHLAISLESLRATPLTGGHKHNEWLKGFDAVHEAHQAFWRKLRALLRATYEGNKYNIPSTIIDDDIGDVNHWDSEGHRANIEAKRQQILQGLGKSEAPAGR